MKLSAHLQRFAQHHYTELIIHPELAMQDAYVFTSNRLLRELNLIALTYQTEIEIINIDCDDDFAIPTFVLVTKPGEYTQRLHLNDALDDFFDKYHVEFVAAYMKSYFAS